MKHKLSVVINYCTNDEKFITHCLNACLKITNSVFLVYSNHFFDGSKENLDKINKLKNKYPQVTFLKLNFNRKNLRYFWDKSRLLSKIISKFYLYGSQYWICKQRFLGFKYANKISDYTLFLDTDEIIDYQNFNKWLNTNLYNKFNVLKFANYWYFREPSYQAITFEDSPVMVRNSAFNPMLILNRNDRQNFYEKITNPKQRMVLGLNQKPMIHHYGWVRSKESMLKKTKTWGHNYYVNWENLINKEFSHDFNGTDFVQGYKFKTVKPFINFA